MGRAGRELKRKNHKSTRALFNNNFFMGDHNKGWGRGTKGLEQEDWDQASVCREGTCFLSGPSEVY